MRTMLFIGAVALVGCASVDQIPNTSSMELCTRVATGNTLGLPRSAFYQELSRRGEDCSSYQGMIAAQQRSNAQSDATGLMLLQMAQP